MIKGTERNPLVEAWPRFTCRSPHLVPTSVCRTLSPLEPDVPMIQSYWLSLRCDSHHRINENIREGGEEKKCSMRRGFAYFPHESFLISDFKSCASSSSDCFFSVPVFHYLALSSMTWRFSVFFIHNTVH